MLLYARQNENTKKNKKKSYDRRITKEDCTHKGNGIQQRSLFKGTT
jgi:hypothetical protein